MARQFYGRYKVARQKAALRNNTRVIKNFEQDALAMVKDASVASLQQLAPLLLEQAINEAGFSDYTGVLINSYMVGLMINGRFVNVSNINRYAKGAHIIATNETHWSSFGMPGTTKIKKGRPYHRNGFVSGTKLHRYRHGRGDIDNRLNKKTYWLIQNRMRRNPKSTEFMPFRESEFKQQGFGSAITKMKGMRGSIREGAELILANGAPYAEFVHQFNRGSKVFLSNLRNVSFVSITRKQLERAIVAHRINQKYGSTGGSKLYPSSHFIPY